ncbi:nuclear transport factor 2 family protein [Streptomyces sp. 3MP-14]|uniref:Nuclear transport factor 2 family protein n=1 Tax=Streptomyces mimosae TaxID=2586635 RepID=A0A5N6AQE1_9ACTN|nr:MULTISPECIES: nuclear transport factor 2 family protein [Streptomyces]KAB8169919.1 nuclear transport factor 2 family protein [Streptomyces mimosae]KAB8178667.1 nuclear transport factor 2 family protein [Streptomyces sp. 3MP-14]
MTDTLPEADSLARVVLHSEVQQFYARHMQLLDAGRADEWALTFTEDGVFAPEHRPEPVTGRAALTAAVSGAYAALVEKGEVRRHWHGMLDVTQNDDGTVGVRCYALIVGTPLGGEARVVMSCVCEDLLVREDGELKVKHRRVTKDGVAAPV